MRRRQWEQLVSWQTLGLLKAVLCSLAIGIVLMTYVLRRLQCTAYDRYFRFASVLMLAGGAAAYFNFGRFLGGGITDSILWYDFYHYYMGAKYFPELHYDGLYRATVVADDEDARMFRGVKGFGWVRDLKADRPNRRVSRPWSWCWSCSIVRVCGCCCSSSCCFSARSRSFSRSSAARRVSWGSCRWGPSVVMLSCTQPDRDGCRNL